MRRPRNFSTAQLVAIPIHAMECHSVDSPFEAAFLA
jgi:hypothetical protein